MIKISFYPDSDEPKFINAALEYQKFWEKEGALISKAIEKISGLKFKEKSINAVVYEGISRSHPLSLRASYDGSTKKAVLIHELCHRLLSTRKLKIETSNRQQRRLVFHKTLYLILYDIWVDLYGENFAKKSVRRESKWHPTYKEAWRWALSFNREERSKKFSNLKP